MGPGEVRSGTGSDDDGKSQQTEADIRNQCDLKGLGVCVFTGVFVEGDEAPGIEEKIAID